MTLIDTIDAARRILKDKLPSTRTFPDNSSSFFEDGEMTDWYNWAQLEIQNKLVQTFENWFVTSTSISLIAGQEEYAMPCACLKVVRVEDNTDSSAPIEIVPISFNDKDRNPEYPSYSIKGNKFILRPRPDESVSSGVRVYYSRRADAITSATDTSIIPVEYHELLMWGVVENGMIKQEATAEALSVVLGRRNRLVEDLMKTGENRQVQRSRQVKRKKRSL